MRGEARSDDYKVTGRRPGDVVTAAVLWTLWALSVLPLVVLSIEFNDGSNLCSLDASFYAKLYGHMFVYPIAFGLPATIFLTRPWIGTVWLIRDLNAPRRRRIGVFLASSIVVIVAFASWAEFTYSTPALWSFKAAAGEVVSTTEAEDLVVIRDACEALKEWREESTERTGAAGVENDMAPQQEVKPLSALAKLAERQAPRSFTRWAYYVYFIGNTTWVALLFGIVVVRTGLKCRSQLGLILVATALATAWVPFRMAFLVEKADLYDDDLRALNYLIFLAFAALHIHTLRLYASGLGSWRRQVALWAGNFVVVLVNLLAVLIGLLVKDAPFGGADLLVRYFGWQSSPLVYVTMLLLFLVVVAPTVIAALGSQPRKEGS